MTAGERLAAGMIEVTDRDLATLAQRAFALSVPQGLGFLHYAPGPLPRALAEKLVSLDASDPRCALSLDYVQGRAVKLRVLRASDDPARLFIYPDWYDHTPEQLAELLATPTPTEDASA